MKGGPKNSFAYVTIRGKSGPGDAQDDSFFIGQVRYLLL